MQDLSLTPIESSNEDLEILPRLLNRKGFKTELITVAGALSGLGSITDEAGDNSSEPEITLFQEPHSEDLHIGVVPLGATIKRRDRTTQTWLSTMNGAGMLGTTTIFSDFDTPRTFDAETLKQEVHKIDTGITTENGGKTDIAGNVLEMLLLFADTSLSRVVVRGGNVVELEAADERQFELARVGITDKK